MLFLRLASSTELESKLRAISALKRDAKLEEQKIKEAEMAAIATRTRSKSKSLSPKSARLPLPQIPGVLHDITVDSAVDPATLQAPNLAQSDLLLSSSAPLSRRTSAISMSSLHRPPFPHRIDIPPSPYLRIVPEEVSMFTSGLASPVTLAPRSARPSATSEYPPDFMAAFAGADASNGTVGIDLTIPNLTSHDGLGSSVDQMAMVVDPAIGSSADKPIELDLENMDLSIFGDPAGPSTNTKLFLPPSSIPDITASIISDDKADKSDHTLQMDILDAYSRGTNDLFASLGPGSPSNASGNDASAQLLSTPSGPITGISSSAPEAGPSPGAILASFDADSHAETGEASIAPNALDSSPGADAQFDLSLEFLQLDNNFFGSAQDGDVHMEDMEAILDMGAKDAQVLAMSEGQN